MKSKCCTACGQSFIPHPQVPNQSYCSDNQCQRERRRRWQRDKLKVDADYRDNQSRSQRAWLDRNPDYWREYRDAHPEYVERNRNQQRGRATSVLIPNVAKMDASNPALPLPSGVYHLSLATDAGIAKMDVWTVEIRVHAYHELSLQRDDVIGRRDQTEYRIPRKRSLYLRVKFESWFSERT